jgi:hypothetical protein
MRAGDRAWKWRGKAALQKALSSAPNGERWNYRLQRATGGLPLNDDKLRAAVAIAGLHVETYRRHGDGDLGSAHFFEFGAGWDLHIPVTHFAFGVKRQSVYDLNPHVKEDLVAEMPSRLARMFDGAQRQRLERVQLDSTSIEGVTRPFGIAYTAPGDARSTSLADGSVDCVTSTSTLEHIPPADIAAILEECRRILRPGGVCSFAIDYRDHFSYFDSSIGPYNFLRFSERAWHRYNSSLQFQNRLRHRDYIELFERSGFAVVADVTDLPTEDERKRLDRLPLAPEFARRPTEDLEILGTHVALVSD